MGKVMDFVNRMLGLKPARTRATARVAAGPQAERLVCTSCGAETMQVQTALGTFVTPYGWTKFSSGKTDPERPGQVEILYFCPKAVCRSQLTWRTWNTMKESA